LQTHVGLNQERDSLMMKAETLLPLDLELQVLGQGTGRREQIGLTKGQFEVLEIVAKSLDQTISKWLTESILSMLECELEDNVAQKLRRKLASKEVDQ
jgi:hypothetical protein